METTEQLIEKYESFIKELSRSELKQALIDIPNGSLESEEDIMFIGPEVDKKHLLSLVEGRLFINLIDN